MSAGEGKNVAFSDDRLSAKEAIGKTLLYVLLACLGFGPSMSRRTSILVWWMIFRLLFSNRAVVIDENEYTLVVWIHVAGSSCVSRT